MSKRRKALKRLHRAIERREKSDFARTLFGLLLQMEHPSRANEIEVQAATDDAYTVHLFAPDARERSGFLHASFLVGLPWRSEAEARRLIKPYQLAIESCYARA